MSGPTKRDDDGDVIAPPPKRKPRGEQPRQYKVIILNDDYSTLEFVVLLIQKIFAKSEEDALRMAQEVHTKGLAVAGIYPYEIAETKCWECHLYASHALQPLKVVMEQD